MNFIMEVFFCFHAWALRVSGTFTVLKIHRKIPRSKKERTKKFTHTPNMHSTEHALKREEQKNKLKHMQYSNGITVSVVFGYFIIIYLFFHAVSEPFLTVYRSYTFMNNTVPYSGGMLTANIHVSIVMGFS